MNLAQIIESNFLHPPHDEFIVRNQILLLLSNQNIVSDIFGVPCIVFGSPETRDAAFFGI